MSSGEAVIEDKSGTALPSWGAEKARDLSFSSTYSRRPWKTHYSLYHISRRTSLFWRFLQPLPKENKICQDTARSKSLPVHSNSVLVNQHWRPKQREERQASHAKMFQVLSEQEIKSDLGHKTQVFHRYSKYLAHTICSMQSMKNRGAILWGPLGPSARETAGTNGEFKTSVYFTREFKMSLGCSKTCNKKQQREKEIFLWVILKIIFKKSTFWLNGKRESGDFTKWILPSVNEKK